MKNFNKPNLNSQSNEDNFKNAAQENDKSIEVSSFGNKPNLELFYNGAKFGFFSKNNFDPQVIPGECSDNAVISSIKEIYKKSPANTILSGKHKDYTEDAIKKIIDKGSKTYQNSVSKDSVREVANFTAKLCMLDKDLMELSEVNDIHELKELSPRQAMLLSANVVMKLKNYDYSEMSDRHGMADKMSTLEIMKSLLKDKYTPVGVCRNYSDMTMIVFNSLKKLQNPETTRLANTYCREVLGENPWDAINPTKPKTTTGHKYNQFITFTNDGVAITNIDPTWSNLNSNLSAYSSLATNVVEREPLISGFIKDFYNKGLFKSPEDRKNIESMRQYYIDISIKIDKYISKLSQKGYDRKNNKAFEKIQNMQYHSLLKSTELSEILYLHGLLSDQEMGKYQKIKSIINNEIQKIQ
ncbi:MAG: hypothetical protein WAV68_01605 [Candidatus Nanogingivalis sp.]